ncbi:MAG: M6 family metalloprotease domain-containing protein, partial [Bacillota bacterium]
MRQLLIIKKGMLILVLGIILVFAGSICVHASGPVPSPVIDYSFKTNPNAAVNRKALIVLVSFNDRALTYTNDQEWSNSLFGTSGATLRNFFDEESEGKTIFGPAEESYGTANDGVIKVHLNTNHPGTADKNKDQVHDELAKIFKKQIIANIDSYVNFKSFDKNNNGKLSPEELIITFVFAGYETTNNPTFPGVWPFADATGLGTAFDGVTMDGKTAVFSGEIQGENRAKIGVYCHEFGHCLGLPDLYHHVGIHSLMGTGSNHKMGGEIPIHLDPWSKIKLGYLKPVIANRSGIYTVNSFKAATGKNVLRINTNNPKEYFLIENRQLSGFDSSLYPACGYGGIAIWHIDETKAVNEGGVDLEGAKTNIKGEEINPYHFYAQGSDYTLLDDTDKTNTYTTAKLNNGSNSGIKVEVLSTSSDSMNVRITAPEIYIDTNERGPKISSFTASTNEIAVGESVNLKAVLKENIAPISEVTFKIIKDGIPQSDYITADLSSVSSNGNYTYDAVCIPNNYYSGEGKFLFYLDSATDIYGNKSKYTGYSVAVNVNNSTSNVNIAKQKPVTASRELPYEPASNAVNGIISRDNNADKWCTGVGYGNGSWLRVYLGGTKTLNRWKVVHEKASGSAYHYLFTKKYRLQASDDGENWRDIDIVDNSLGLGITDRPVAPFKCSYVRLYIDEADRDNCARICEFQVYNDTITGIDANFDGKNTEQISGFKRYAGSLHYTS